MSNPNQAGSSNMNQDRDQRSQGNKTTEQQRGSQKQDQQKNNPSDKY